jgi:nitrite reductase/ring-hydroxylating ferredoxin subunit
MKHRLAAKEDIARGGIKSFEIDGREILLCNHETGFFALERRCGHMNAPCEMGTLRGHILTCPMHFAQFDITTGKVLKKAFLKSEPEGLPEKFRDFFEHKKELAENISTCDMMTFTTIVDGDDVYVEM